MDGRLVRSNEVQVGLGLFAVIFLLLGGLTGAVIEHATDARKIAAAHRAERAAQSKLQEQTKDMATLGQILSRSNEEIRQLTSKNSQLAAIGAREEASRKAGWQSAMNQTVALNNCEMAAIRLRNAQQQGEQLSPGAVAALTLLKALVR